MNTNKNRFFIQKRKKENKTILFFRFSKLKKNKDNYF